MASIKIKYEEEFVTTGDGLKLFTCRWLPEAAVGPKALVFLLHGYAMECSVSMNGTATRLARAGYGVYGMDCVGHGRSDGLHGYIPNFEDVVHHYSTHYTNICEKEENAKRKRYLMGESMGGAVALLLHRKMPDFWNGVVLIAPMCKMADDMKPNPLVTKILTKLSEFVPTWKLVPGQDIIEAAVRDPEAKKKVRANPYWYTGRPRLKTASELYNVTLDLEHRLHEVTLPFLVVHGGADKVTDPAISKLLYDTASSFDKTFKLYEGMWHALTYGELPENIDRVFTDIIEWLDDRSTKDSSRVEKEKKRCEDRDVSTFRNAQQADAPMG